MDAVVETEGGWYSCRRPSSWPAGRAIAADEDGAQEPLLKTALAPLLKRYDVIMLDCHPSLGVLTTMGVDGCPRRLDPLVGPDHRGVGKLLDTIHDVKRMTDRRLKVIGVLPTLFDARTSHGGLVLERIGEDYGVTVSEPPIPKSVRFAEAPAAGRSILATARTSKGASFTVSWRVRCFPHGLRKARLQCWSDRAQSRIRGYRTVGAVGGGLVAPPSQAVDSTEIFVVQGLPNRTVDVEIDGKSVATASRRPRWPAPSTSRRARTP